MCGAKSSCWRPWGTCRARPPRHTAPLCLACTGSPSVDRRPGSLPSFPVRGWVANPPLTIALDSSNGCARAALCWSRGLRETDPGGINEKASSCRCGLRPAACRVRQHLHHDACRRNGWSGHAARQHRHLSRGLSSARALPRTGNPGFGRRCERHQSDDDVSIDAP